MKSPKEYREREKKTGPRTAGTILKKLSSCIQLSFPWVLIVRWGAYGASAAGSFK